MAERAVPLAVMLREVPRSLATLSAEHADGWGVAVRDGSTWTIEKSVAQAARCPKFEAVCAVRAQVAVAHVRKKTVGETALENTHPFRRGTYVFAHNGTADSGWLAARSSPERLAEIEGATDSERLFAFVMTHIDEVGAVGAGVSRAAAALRSEPAVGSVNFLLSDGASLHALRLGRSLYVLRRGGGGCRRAKALAVASEPLSAEAWTEVEQGSLVTLALETLSPESGLGLSA